MNTYKKYSKTWLLLFVLVAFAAGCGHKHDDAAVQSSDKTMSAYSLGGVTGTIDETAKTISVTMPNGTNATNLIATFSTTGTSVTAGSMLQASGATPNDFTSPVAYTVTAGDGTTTIYTVTVTVVSNSAKAITAYSLGGIAATIDETAKTVSVTMPNGTNVAAQIATYTTTGIGVTIGTVVQSSGTTSNDFTHPVDYTVTAIDNSTAIYTVTVNVSAATGLAPVDLLSAGGFVILAQTAITDIPASAITGSIGVSAAAGSFIGVTCEEMTGKIYTVDATYVGSGNLACVAAGPGANKVLVDQAIADMGTAYGAAFGRAAGVGASNLNVGTGTLSGLNFVPGTYTWTSGDVNITGNITLTGGASDVWIFQMAGNLNVGSCASCSSAGDFAGIKVTLAGGAKAANVFWQVGGGAGATLGTYSTFNGTILSATQVIMQTGSVLNGRALAQTQVTLDTATVTQP